MQMRQLSTAVIALLISACASKESVIPQPEHTMQTLYHQSSGGQQQNLRLLTSSAATQDDVNVNAYVLHDSPRADFQLLPNPTLFMFVQTHLTADGSPVPGYITEFKMFERDEYALPGEVGVKIGGGR